MGIKVKVLSLEEGETFGENWVLADFGLADDGKFYYLVLDPEVDVDEKVIATVQPELMSFTVAALLNEEYDGNREEDY